MASEFLPRIPKKVEGTSKYLFGWKGEKKKDTDDETWTADKQLQVETGRLAAHYLGEFERALEKWKKTHETNTKTNAPKDGEWTDAENLVNMYTIYKISKDMYDTMTDAQKDIPESSVEIQIPGMLFGYSVRERKLNINNKDIADFAVFLNNESPWIKKNLLLQYPIRKYKNDVRPPIVLKKENIIFSGSSANPNTHEFPGSTVRKYDILAKLLNEHPSLKNSFKIDESAIVSARNGTYKLFFPENGQPFRISKESDFLGAPSSTTSSISQTSSLPQTSSISTSSIATSSLPLASSFRGNMKPSTTTTTTSQSKSKLPSSFAAMAGQTTNSNSNSNTNSTSSSSSSSSSSSNTKSTSSNSNSNATPKVNQNGGKKKSRNKRFSKSKTKSKSKKKHTKSKKH